MLVFLRIFLILISLYHIIITTIWFGFLGWWWNFWISYGKEIIWILFVLSIWFWNYKQFFWFIKKYLKEIVLITLLLIYWVVLSILNGKSSLDIIVGFKYNIYYLIILLSSIFLGYMFDKKNIQKFIKFIMQLILGIIIFWLIWQIGKMLFPNFFLGIWYWPIWDYVMWKNPPLYYRTWPGWEPRLSWVFAGPNNYGFFLVGFFAMYVMSVLKSKMSKFKKWLYSWLYIISSLLTISRWAIIWILFQAYLISINFLKKHKKTHIIWILIIILWILWISLRKHSSTINHLQAWIDGIKYFLIKPMWYWLGTSWPAIHYNWYILPENIFLQILIDIWAIWFLIWSLFIFMILRNIANILKNKKNSEYRNYILYLSFWLLWILIEWMFLHVFEDSMVNYIFFCTLWILIWHLNKERT